jgi:hypothetical protein
MRRTVKITMDDSIYHNIMFLLNNLKMKGLEIEELEENISGFSTKAQIKELFSNNDIEAFKSIDDPIQWQKNQRDEWQ